MDEPIKPTTIRTLGSFAGRFSAPAGGSAPSNIDTSDKVRLKSSGDLTAEIQALAQAVKQAAAQPIQTDADQPLYRVRKGDSLALIAADQLGDANRWPEIAALNTDQYPSLAHNPALIREGWTLQLPTISAAPEFTEPTSERRAEEDPCPPRGPRARKAAPVEPAPQPRWRREIENDDPLFANDQPPQIVRQPARPVANDDGPPAKKAGKPAKPARPVANDDCPPAKKGGKPAANPGNVAAAANDYLKNAHITGEKTKVVALDTETDTNWDVQGDSATVTGQKTKVTAADTRTNAHWEQDGKPAPAAKKPIKPAVPVSLDGVVLEPNANDRIAAQKTVVTGADTVTDSHFEVNGGQETLTGQKTVVTGADTHTDTVWKRPVSAEPVAAPIQEGPRVPVSLKGLVLQPGQNMEIESQDTQLDEIDTGTDTHWQIEGDQAKATNQRTNVTGAETITRTRWKVTGSPVPQPPAPPQPRPCSEAEAVAWLQAHLDANGRISRETIATMPEGPGKQALLEHFDALLFGYIDPGQQGWVQLHTGDVDALARALADGGSIKGFAGQLTRRITSERGLGDLNGDGRVDESDLAAYAARLRAGQPYEPAKPAPPAPTNGIERMQHDLQVYLDDRNNQNSDAALSLVRDHAQYVQVATPAQKATLIGRLDGSEDARNAALSILQTAAGRKELQATLEAVNQRKKGMDTLLNRLGDNDQGKQLARLLLDHGNLYQQPLVWQHMDDDATVSLCEALGFKHPMVGTSDELLALSDEARNHMIKELTGGNVTWTELYMAQWINQHNQIPYHIPDYLTENRNGGRR